MSLPERALFFVISRSASPERSDGSSSSPAPGVRDENLPLVWALLYDPDWRLPTADAEAAWADALGDTDPMQVRAVWRSLPRMLRLVCICR